MAEQLLIGFLFASLIALASSVVRFLTPAGSAAQFILGFVLLGVGGWQWTIPMLVFFILSSLLSQSGRKRRARAEPYFEKSSRRDAMQVIANGGVAGIVTLLWFATSNDALYVAYLGAVAAATADTWGTELGTLSHSRPFLITSFRRVDTGRSGAVSIPGLFAGVAGAFAILLSARHWIRDEVWVASCVAVVAGGTLGSIADSLLGAKFQAQFRCSVCGRETEREIHCSQRAEHISGRLWIRNDIVNIVCTVVGALVSYYVFSGIP